VIFSKPVLGTRLHVVNYDSAVEQILQWSETQQVRCVAAANTHLLGEAVSNPTFGDVLNAFDLIVPDGMPLVWALRLDGVLIDDRVYGPYLMQHVLKASASRSTRHFFLGGSDFTLDQLKDNMLKKYPELTIAGAMSPPFAAWSPETEQSIIQAIESSEADCIWVALGGVKQETWIHHIKSKLKRGVLIAIGDAFVLNAGLRSFAPAWMQRCGLTWLWRLLQEPKRLAKRYATYHWRFFKAFMAERWRMSWE
jgi:N-acetylglucosaminyldiphosphoundecaprenol N-acetyl-beta-D-mannosaminyltransferase